MDAGMDIGHMTPRRPYLLRAFYDWLLENELRRTSSLMPLYRA